MDHLKKDNNAFFRQLIFIIVLVGMGFVIYYHLSFFLSSVLGAIALYCVFSRFLFKLVEQRKWKSWVASLLLVSVAVLILLGIAYAMFVMVAAEIPTIDASGIIEEINKTVLKINDYVGYVVISANTLVQAKQFLISVVSGLLNTTYTVVANLFMMIVLLYFMFANARAMEKVLLTYSPFQGTSLDLLKREVKNMIYGNVVGIPVIMIFQGLVAALGYWVFGLKDIGFWAFMTAFFGLVPIVGSTIIWLPMGVYLISGGQTWQGVVLILYGLLIISNVDNVCRLILMKKMADIHPLVTILGVMLGIPMFGFWGIIFGPLLISGFLLLLKIYYEEYGANAAPEQEI